MSPTTVIALALIAGIVATVVQLVRAQRKLKRLENEAREVRRHVEAKRAEIDVERKRAEWKERKWRKFGGEWE